MGSDEFVTEGLPGAEVTSGGVTGVVGAGAGLAAGASGDEVVDELVCDGSEGFITICTGAALVDVSGVVTAGVEVSVGLPVEGGFTAVTLVSPPAVGVVALPGAALVSPPGVEPGPAGASKVFGGAAGVVTSGAGLRS